MVLENLVPVEFPYNDNSVASMKHALIWNVFAYINSTAAAFCCCSVHLCIILYMFSAKYFVKVIPELLSQIRLRKLAKNSNCINFFFFEL